MAPVAGAKHSGFQAETAPPYKKYRYFALKYRYLVLNNTGIAPKLKFYFSMPKFATRRVCGYLHGPCGFVITAGAAQRHSNPQVAVERSKSAQIQKFASRLLSSRCGFSAFYGPFWPRFRAPGALGSAGGFFAPNHPNL